MLQGGFWFLDSLFTDRVCAYCGVATANDFFCEKCLKKIEDILEQLCCCEQCGHPLILQRQKCSRCLKNEQHYFFKNHRCLGLYEGELKKLIQIYKIGQQKHLAYFFAKHLHLLYQRFFVGYTIVPVPPRRGKIFYSGWDQVRLLSIILHKSYKLPLVFALKRLDNHKQKKYNRRQRLASKQRFMLCRKLDNPPYLLFDDVMTTGTTLNRCAEILSSKGQQDIKAMSIAMV